VCVYVIYNITQFVSPWIDLAHRVIRYRADDDDDDDDDDDGADGAPAGDDGAPAGDGVVRQRGRYTRAQCPQEPEPAPAARRRLPAAAARAFECVNVFSW
jgi:hypothetical protein